MKLIEISPNYYASKYYLTDFYPGAREKLQETLASGEDFQTEWFGCRKEIRYARYTRENNQLLVEVTCDMDDLYLEDDLIYDALWTTCRLEIELPEEVIDSIREAAIADGLDDSTSLSETLPGDATLDDIIRVTDELEGRCECGNEGMYDTLCEIVKAHVEYFSLGKEE